MLRGIPTKSTGAEAGTNRRAVREGAIWSGAQEASLGGDPDSEGKETPDSYWSLYGFLQLDGAYTHSPDNSRRNRLLLYISRWRLLSLKRTANQRPCLLWVETQDHPPWTGRGASEPSGLSVEWADSVDTRSMDEAVLQISGAGHWFLEGWIGDHSVDLWTRGPLWRHCPAPFIRLWRGLEHRWVPCIPFQGSCVALTARLLTYWDTRQFVVSFLGLQTEFPILVCDLSTDTIIGTTTHFGHKERVAVHGGRCVITATSYGRRFVGPCFHRGTLFNSPVFWGGASLHHMYGGGPVHAIQWPFGGSYGVCGEHGAWWWVERWWTHPDGEFQFWCLILVRRPLWWNRFLRLTWSPRSRPFSPSWISPRGRRVTRRRYRIISRDCWTRRLKTWMAHRGVS